MFSMFRRQRRRLALFALIAALPFAALVFASVMPLRGPTFAACAASIAGFCLMGLPLLILRFAPGLRSACEGLVIGVIVGVALQVATLPLSGIPMLGPWQAIIGLALLLMFFAFDLPNRLLPTRDYIGTDRFRTKQSVYTLWADHLPDPGLLDRHWSDALHSLEMDKRDPTVRVATYRTGEGDMRQRQRMTEETTYNSFAYDFTQLQDDGSEGPTGTYAVSIEDQGSYRDVTISHRVNALPIRAWLAAWLDDIVGDECDHHVARTESRADYSITGAHLRKAPHRLIGPIVPIAVTS